MTSTRPFSPDTSPEAQKLLVKRWREMAAWEKAQLVTELSRDCERLARAGIRSESPGVTPEREHFLLAVRRLGRTLALRAYGDPTLSESP